MLTTIANVLAGLIGAGIVLIGVLGIVAPRGSVGFGIPDTPADSPSFQAWLTVKAVRDLACALFLFILLAAGPTQLLGWFMLAAACIPVGDASIVLRVGGPKSAAYGVHGATAAVMLAVGALLLVAA
ncbi:DUF4267 domain-containing protein [Streptomyces sp. NPDC001770]